MTKRIAVVMIVAVLAAGAASGDTQVRVVANMATHFDERPSAGEAFDAFGRTGQPVFYGPGWEVLFDHVGLGGNYMVRFFEDDLNTWWVDWVGEALFLSYHFVGAGHMFDPYVSFAVGGAGRSIAEHDEGGGEPVYLSIFPVLTAGLSFDLQGFLIGGRLAYIPDVGAVPGTDIAIYPLERFQVAFYGGVAIGAHRRHEQARPQPEPGRPRSPYSPRHGGD